MEDAKIKSEHLVSAANAFKPQTPDALHQTSEQLVLIGLVIAKRQILEAGMLTHKA